MQALICLHNFIITRELAADEEYHQYFPERLMNQFIQEHRAVADDDDEEENNIEPDVIVNDDIDEHALRNVLANYFVNH